VHGKGRVPEELGAIEVCKYMGGWTWDDYLAQPAWLVDLVRGKMNLDAEYERFRAKQSKNA
jgi:hypothetical protein